VSSRVFPVSFVWFLVSFGAFPCAPGPSGSSGRLDSFLFFHTTFLCVSGAMTASQTGEGGEAADNAVPHRIPEADPLDVTCDSGEDVIETPKWLSQSEKTDKAIRRMAGKPTKTGSLHSSSSSGSHPPTGNNSPPRMVRQSSLTSTSSLGHRGGTIDSDGISRLSSLSQKDQEKVIQLKEAYDSVPLEVKGKIEAWRIKEEEIELGDMLGQGMVGMIYKAKWRGSPVAAKCLKGDLTRDTVGWHDLLSEIQILSVLRHPNLVQFLGASVVADRNSSKPPIIVYELMGGGSLEDILRIQTTKYGFWRPSRAQAWVWGKDLFRALCFMHQCSPPLLHRDIKPANLLLTSDLQTLKVGDFGLCKAVQFGNIEMTGETGTKRYMAPEVHRNDPHYSTGADLYSASLILWLMNTGYVPYGECSINVIGQKVSLEHHRPPLDKVDWPELRPVIQQAWAPGPGERGDAAEILERLEKLPSQPSAAELQHLGDLDSRHHCRCCVS